MKWYIYITGIFVLLFSCQKDRLKDEKAIFIGTWNWTYTYHSYNYCEGTMLEENLTPVTENSTYKLKFMENGEFYLFKNDDKVLSYKMKFKIFNSDSQLCPEENWFQYGIALNNNDELSYGGCISSDTLITTGFKGFDFTPLNYSCENYLSYFTKE